MAEGYSNKRIAELLNASLRAIENRVGAIFTKLDLSTDVTHQHRRVMAVLTFLRDGRDPDEESRSG
jgi:DNA-binding NarL/FixJ family response regulator